MAKEGKVGRIVPDICVIVKSRPSPDAPAVTFVENEEVTVFERESTDDYYKVRTNYDKDGYIAKDLIVMNENATNGGNA